MSAYKAPEQMTREIQELVINAQIEAIQKAIRDAFANRSRVVATPEVLNNPVVRINADK